MLRRSLPDVLPYRMQLYVIVIVAPGTARSRTTTSCGQHRESIQIRSRCCPQPSTTAARPAMLRWRSFDFAPVPGATLRLTLCERYARDDTISATVVGTIAKVS